MNDTKNILICPLEWGLGHAGRMVPVAKKLQELNNNVFFASGKEHINFLRIEVTGATYIHFPGFRIKYSRYLPQYLIILLKSPLLLWHSILEHHLLKKIIRDHSIDIIISDSRLGLWNSGIKSVFVTHQLRIQFPFPFRFLEPAGRWIICSVIMKYDFCFVPDLPGEHNLSGNLSHGFTTPDNVRYIGILSRFIKRIPSDNYSPEGCTVILSGPEPQRSILKQKLSSILVSRKVPSVMLEGKPDKTEKSYKTDYIIHYNHLSADETIELLLKSGTIITRSGYTTIMELISLGKSALVIPTPGQTEQEYLAEYLSGKGWFTTVKQKDINDRMDINTGSAILPAGINEESEKLLGEALSELLE